MGIETIQACRVTCQNCKAEVIVEKWVQARALGWAVPCDGRLQLCPNCVIYQKGVLSATAIPAGSLANKLPGET